MNQNDEVPSVVSLNVLPEGALARIRGAFRALPEAEQRVARFFAERPEEAVRLPVKSLAPLMGVSEASVVRCCQSLGYHGLRELKLALATETVTPLQAIHEDIAPHDDDMTIAGKVLRSDIQAIADTLAVLDGAEFGRAVAALLGATRIECYGVGSSLPVAVDAYYRFLRIGLPATVVGDPHMLAVSASLLPAGAVAFAVSHTGHTVETLDAIRKAKLTGATTILLTSFANTPLGREADIVLVTSARETAFRTEAMASRIAHLCVVDALYVTTAMRRFDTAITVLDETARIIAEHRVQ